MKKALLFALIFALIVSPVFAKGQDEVGGAGKKIVLK